ncbi:MAG: hypothetical protein JSR49_00015 [Proteobacteria bacterium]|nr:hypothetical protein [Pseudomonadota bacterium]
MLTDDGSPDDPGGGLQLPMADELRDQLISTSSDLGKLRRLLAHTSAMLLEHFEGASGELKRLATTEASPTARALNHLDQAIEALQFEDLAAQLISHTDRRLRYCANRFARTALGDDEITRMHIKAMPPDAGPVMQDEVGAGSIELF